MNKKIIGYFFGVFGLIFGVLLNIYFPLTNEHIFFNVGNNGIVINLIPNILLFFGLFCIIGFVCLVNDKKEKNDYEKNKV